MTKKFFAIFVLMLFMVSVIPFVAAENNGRGQRGADTDVVTVDAEPEPMKVREEVKERKEVTAEKTRERVEKTQQKRKELVLQKREVAKERKNMLQSNFEDAKRRYNEAKDKYQNVRETFLERKRMMKECEGQETEECKLARRDANDAAKQFLLNSIERAKTHFEQLQARIGSAEGMSEEEVTEMSEDVNDQMLELEGLAEEVEDAETNEDLREVANQLENTWKKQKEKANKYAGRLIHSKVGEIIVQARQLEAKLERTMERLEKKGVDISSIDATGVDVAAFGGYIDTARSKFDEAKTLFEEGKVDEAKALVREAHESLKEAHLLLRDLVRNVKAAGGDIEAEDEAPEEEIVEEAPVEEEIQEEAPVEEEEIEEAAEEELEDEEEIEEEEEEEVEDEEEAAEDEEEGAEDEEEVEE